MKTNMFKSLVTVALAGTALTLGACKKAPETTSNDKGDAPKTEGGGKPEGGAPKGDTPPPTPEPAPAGKKIAEQLVGYWAPDKASLEAIMAEEMAGQFGGEGGPGAAIADKVIGPMVEAMLEFFVFQLDGKNAWVLGPEGLEDQGPYELVSADEATGAFVVKTTDKETGETEDGEGSIKGDSLELSMDGKGLKMNRITEADFEARKGKAENFNPEALLAPLMQEILGGLEGLGEGLPEGGAPGELPPGFPTPEQ